MLDVHAVTSSGSQTTLAAISTIAAGGDGQVVAGVPIRPDAVLVGWGGATTVADLIELLKLTSQDQIDPINGSLFNFTSGTIARQIQHAYENLPYKTGQRLISMAQKTGAANNYGYTIDYYPDLGPACLGKNGYQDYKMPYKIHMPQVYGGALTAITWGTQAVAPATQIPLGRYALLGATVNALTNTALIRFQHADFGPFLPGFPVFDEAAAATIVPDDHIFRSVQDYQFVWYSLLTGLPCIPTFTVSNAGTGLNLQVLSITADTPMVNLNLAKIA